MDCCTVVGAGAVILYALHWLLMEALERRAVAKRRQAEEAAWPAQQAAWERAQQAQQEAWERAQQALALTCRRCQALAPPIPGTGNRYRCLECGNQFAAARHKQ